MVKSVYYWLGRKKNFSNHRAQETLLLGFLLLGERVRITVACKQNGSGSVTIKRLWPARLNPSLSFARESVKLRSKVEFNTMRVRRVHEANEAVTSKKKERRFPINDRIMKLFRAVSAAPRGATLFLLFSLFFFFEARPWCSATRRSVNAKRTTDRLRHAYRCTAIKRRRIDWLEKCW